MAVRHRPLNKAKYHVFLSFFFLCVYVIVNEVICLAFVFLPSLAVFLTDDFINLVCIRLFDYRVIFTVLL